MRSFVPQGHAFEATPRVEVRDDGARYEVVVRLGEALHTRTYEDPERSCEQRLRFSGVFVVLTILPPELWPEDVADGLQLHDATSPAPRPEAPRLEPEADRDLLGESAAEPKQPGPLRLELAGTLEGSPYATRHAEVRQLGGELRAAFGHGAWAASAGLHYSPEADFDAGTVRSKLERAALRGGLRLRTRSRDLAAYGELSAVAMLSRVRGAALLHPATDSALDVGAALELGTAWSGLSGFGPLLAARVTLVPQPAELSADPQGDVARLPFIWFGGVFGCVFEP